MIKDNLERIYNDLPNNVSLVAAVKTRAANEILEAIDAGVKIIGENYVQEAEKVYPSIGMRVEWHLIGHLQRNKVKNAVKIFDMIETVDSVRLAEEINKRCEYINKKMKVLIEINSGREDQKSGIFPENAGPLIKDISNLKYIDVCGLMTMGVWGDVEESRKNFKVCRKLFDEIKGMKIENIRMEYLSMGMSDTYKIAIEEGANIVRIGTGIFGVRKY